MSEAKKGLDAIWSISRFIDKYGQKPSRIILETQGRFSGHSLCEIHSPFFEITIDLLSITMNIEGTAISEGRETMIKKACEIWHFNLSVDSSDNQMIISDAYTTLTIIAKQD